MGILWGLRRCVGACLTALGHNQRQHSVHSTAIRERADLASPNRTEVAEYEHGVESQGTWPSSAQREVVAVASHVAAQRASTATECGPSAGEIGLDSYTAVIGLPKSDLLLVFLVQHDTDTCSEGTPKRAFDRLHR